MSRPSIEDLREKLDGAQDAVLSPHSCRLLYNLVKNMTVPKETEAVIELLELVSRGE